jgi:multisubunit Na+/H+ antiporter MnhB subunit
MPERENIRIMKEFRKRQTRQIIAVATALFLVLLVAVIHKRPDIFGEFSSGVLFAAQAVFIAAFIGFSAVNWRCPSCNRHLGGDIYRRACRKCGVRLQ